MASKISVRSFQSFAKHKSGEATTEDSASVAVCCPENIGIADALATRDREAAEEEGRFSRLAPGENNEEIKGTTSSLVGLLRILTTNEAVQLHRDRVVHLFFTQISESGFPVDHADAHERCWRCSSRFTKSELKIGPFFSLGSVSYYHALYCGLCQPEISTIYKPYVLQGNHIHAVLRIGHDAVKDGAGMYVGNRGSYWINRALSGSRNSGVQLQPLPLQFAGVRT